MVGFQLQGEKPTEAEVERIVGIIINAHSYE
jgi:hypothetical protein